MRRRRFLGVVALSVIGPASGCVSFGDRRGTATEPLDPSWVTTTGGDDVEILHAQLVVREGDDGPWVVYRLWNAGDGDATVGVRTVLRIEEGGSYEATTYADVPAGQEVELEYRVVRYDALSGIERENVRAGNADFDTYVDGELQSDA